MSDTYEARLVVKKTDGTEYSIKLDTDDTEGGLKSATNKWYNEICTPEVKTAEFQHRTSEGEWVPVCEFQNGPEKNFASRNEV
jgi:hypothetical protein